MKESSKKVKRKKGSGAPVGNTNGQTHGLRTLRKSCTTTLPTLPSMQITRQMRIIRRTIEGHVLERHGVISFEHELAINTATRHEAAALLIARWLRLKSEDMSHGERLQYIAALGKESDARDRAVERLKLDAEPELPDLANYILDGTIEKGAKP